MSVESENITYTKPILKFLGAPYPITKHPRGFLRTQAGLDQIKSDLLVLLLTNPGERVMMPEFGTPLRKLIFEQGDKTSEIAIRQTIIDSIRLWEPRVNITAINVSIGANIDDVDINRNNIDDIENIALISIIYSDLNELNEIKELKLQLPISGD